MKLFWVNDRRELTPNRLAYYKASNLKKFYEDLAEHYKDAAYFPNVVRQWMGLAPSNSFQTISEWNFTDLNSWIDYSLKHEIIKEKQEAFYAEFQRLFNVRCSELYCNDPEQRNQTLKIRKGTNQRKASINKSLAMLNLPYIVKKERNCWILRPQ